VSSQIPYNRSWLTVGLAAVGVGAVLRVAFLTTGSFWIDEFVTVWVVQAPTWREFATRSLDFTTNSPVYFAIARLSTMLFGVNELGVRLPSVLFGIATLPMMYAVVRRLWQRDDMAAVATWLMAVSPDYIFQAHDARAYSLCVLLALVSLWAFVGVLRQGGAGWLCLTAGANLTLVYVHYLFGLLAAAQTVFLFVWYLRGLLSLRLLLLWLLLQAASLAALYPVADQLRKLAERRAMVAGAEAPRVHVVVDFFMGPDLPRKLIGLGVLFLGLVIWRRDTVRWEAPGDAEGGWRMAMAVVLLWYFVPGSALYLASRVGDVDLFYQARLVSIYALAGFVFMAWIVCGLRPRWAAAAAVTVMIAFTVFYQLRPTKLLALHNKEDWRGSLRLVSERMEPGGLLLLRSGLGEASDPRIVGHPMGRRYVMAPLADLYFTRHDVRTLPLPFAWRPGDVRQYIEQELAPALADANAFWLVARTRSFEHRYPHRFERWLQQRLPNRFRLAEHHRFRAVDVRLYRRGTPATQPIEPIVHP
jgi:dolichyl-phosphate-mannose-protein mannosyltransferase